MKITTKVCGFASHERMRGENRTVLVLGMGTSLAAQMPIIILPRISIRRKCL
jgi:hypothetical protein